MPGRGSTRPASPARSRARWEHLLDRHGELPIIVGARSSRQVPRATPAGHTSGVLPPGHPVHTTQLFSRPGPSRTSTGTPPVGPSSRCITHREERVGCAVHHQCRCGDLREPFAPAWRAVQLREHRAQQAVARRRRVRTAAIENTGHVDAGLGGVELWRAGEHAGRGHRTVQVRRAVGPVDRWSAAEVGHDRRGVLGQVAVDGARRDRAGADQHERGDPRRVVQRQELCDETAGRDAHDVRAGDAEPVEHTDGVGDQVAQRPGIRPVANGPSQP